MFSVVMLLAGLFVWFQFRNQNIHATPPAILLACIASPIVSALLGWCLAPIYVSRRKVAAILFASFVIVVATAFTTAGLYMVASNAVRGAPLFAHPSGRYAVDYAITYISVGCLIWVPGLITIAFLLARASARVVHS